MFCLLMLLVSVRGDSFIWKRHLLRRLTQRTRKEKSLWHFHYLFFGFNEEIEFFLSLITCFSLLINLQTLPNLLLLMTCLSILSIQFSLISLKCMLCMRVCWIKQKLNDKTYNKLELNHWSEICFF